MKVKLGSMYRDKLHGIQGVATSRGEYLTGCSRVLLQYVKDGKVEDYWVDETQVELVEKKVDTPKRRNRGGPQPVAPPRNLG